MARSDILVCMPVDWESYVVPGSVKDKCFNCGRPVWRAPSSFLIGVDKVSCFPCAAPHMAPGNVAPISAAQEAEIKESRRRQAGGTP